MVPAGQGAAWERAGRLLTAAVPRCQGALARSCTKTSINRTQMWHGKLALHAAQDSGERREAATDLLRLFIVVQLSNATVERACRRPRAHSGLGLARQVSLCLSASVQSLAGSQMEQREGGNCDGLHLRLRQCLLCLR